MLTPRFKLKQTETNVTIIIRAPYTSLRNLEVSVQENVFIFVSNPYYLRLHLPGPLSETEDSHSSFDADSGEYTFVIDKATPGDFPDLDLITKLMCPKVEVVDPTGERANITILTGVDDRQINDSDELNEGFGFALAGNKSFKHVSAEFKDVFDVDPKEIGLKDRRTIRVKDEQSKFSPDHYLADYIENDEIEELIALKTPWQDLKPEQIKFDDSELDFLKDLPNVEHKLSQVQINYCYNSLLDLLYAYCYDRRTTEFEGSSESGWTIVKIAASLSWLDVYQTPKEALSTAFRRSLIYPLYRNFALSQKVLDDVRHLLWLGEKYIIRCLIDLYKIFLQGDCCRYVINDLFIRDYIVYVMKWEKEEWREIVETVAKIEMKKNDLGLNLDDLEDDMCQKMNQLTIANATEDDSDDTDSDCSSSSSNYSSHNSSNSE